MALKNTNLRALYGGNRLLGGLPQRFRALGTREEYGGT
jgi:hypothetical protein